MHVSRIDEQQSGSYNLEFETPALIGGSRKKMLATAAGFRLAARFDEVGFSDIVNIRNRVMELRAQGASVYQFEGGEPYRPTPDYIKDAAAEALKQNKTRYAPSSGVLELRKAIAEIGRA